ncbi:hypothetical protein CW749_03140 [Vibrio sp. vnigr-6D03]|uniref:hypothetical protein n=1 Tax=Vibrio sp. vnigr-6D03 TaxID=2058088 RepID=UPI000C335C2C|nr:hypothetical protein [Vibrio sp. vnigr-6D03]PKF81646.1 hypothetical protein CW749_03140 [Vibrio sp. vnigr-6D03]
MRILILISALFYSAYTYSIAIDGNKNDWPIVDSGSGVIHSQITVKSDLYNLSVGFYKESEKLLVPIYNNDLTVMVPIEKNEFIVWVDADNDLSTSLVNNQLSKGSDLIFISSSRGDFVITKQGLFKDNQNGVEIAVNREQGIIEFKVPKHLVLSNIYHFNQPNVWGYSGKVLIPNGEESKFLPDYEPPYRANDISNYSKSGPNADHGDVLSFLSKLANRYESEGNPEVADSLRDAESKIEYTTYFVPRVLTGGKGLVQQGSMSTGLQINGIAVNGTGGLGIDRDGFYGFGSVNTGTGSFGIGVVSRTQFTGDRNDHAGWSWNGGVSTPIGDFSVDTPIGCKKFSFSCDGTAMEWGSGFGFGYYGPTSGLGYTWVTGGTSDEGGGDGSGGGTGTSTRPTGCVTPGSGGGIPC